MSEDVSATMRVGVTVILVASLVAVVLNLMVMSNNLLAGGTEELSSGLSAVQAKEFDKYDSTKIGGSMVQTCIELFKGRDVAVVIQTLVMKEEIGEDAAINLGALLTSDGRAASNDQNFPDKHEGGKAQKPWDSVASTDSAIVYSVEIGKALTKEDGSKYYEGNLHSTTGMVDLAKDTNVYNEQGNAAYIRNAGTYYSSLIKNSSGDTIGIFITQLR